ncbi:MAG: hypothetical protein K5662_06000 [Lachnospiraceae bacterium]|nr:hypothetical protein [Lachnospiraceae bacterium]
MKVRTILYLAIAIFGIYVGGTLIAKTVDIPEQLEGFIDKIVEVPDTEVELTEIRDEEVPLGATVDEVGEDEDPEKEEIR